LKRGSLDTVLLLPYLTIPISNTLMDNSIFRGVLEYKIEGIFGIVTNMGDRGMEGLSPIGFRYNFTKGQGKWVPYSELMLGAVYLDVPRSVQGTRFNFIETATLGVQYFLTRNTTFNCQFRYFHISNAGMREPNQGENLGLIMVGLSHYFK